MIATSLQTQIAEKATIHDVLKTDPMLLAHQLVKNRMKLDKKDYYKTLRYFEGLGDKMKSDLRRIEQDPHENRTFWFGDSTRDDEEEMKNSMIGMQGKANVSEFMQRMIHVYSLCVQIVQRKLVSNTMIQ